MKIRVLAVLLSTTLSSAFAAIHLMQRPTMSRTEIVFSYGGDLWRVSREGGSATRLTGGTGFETEALFSPDGKTVAFTGEYDGNIDIFTMPMAGGVPKRLTWHPAADHVVGWSPDGKKILFRSNRDSHSRYTQLYTVAPEGSPADALPLPMACMGAYSPDGKRMVYAPLDGGQFATGFTNFVAWRRYRGGTASYLWVVNLADLSTVKVPRTDSNDIYPMWVGDKIYFLSDRNGPMTLFRYDPQSKKVDELIKNTGEDIVSASAGPGGIVYEQIGQIHIYDIAAGKEHQVPVDIESDLSEVRPRFQNVSRELRNSGISATGVRAVFEAHGEILTVPAEKGEMRNLTNTPGVMERSPAWSPDGKSVAYFSDESGEYALHIKPQNGAGETKKIPLQGKSAFYFDPKWSPDNKNVAFTDNMCNLWMAEIASGKVTKVDTDYVYVLGRSFNWSGDSKWIAFERFLPNRMRAIFVYAVEGGKATQITDGMSDARHPAFDRDGQYLYFTASTNFGPTSSGLDMTSDEHEVNSSVYLAVLPNNIPSPLGPESDEEGAPRPAAEGSGGGRGGRGGTGGGGPAAQPEAPPKPVRIDFEKLQQRILAMPLPARAYTSLTAGRAGILYLTEPGTAGGGGRGFGGGGAVLTRFDLKTRKSERLAEGVGSFNLSANGDKMLLRMGGGAGGRGGRGPAGAAPAGPPQYVIVPANAPVKAGDGALRIADLEVNVDPVAEWKQMYREAWRIEKSYFYDPNLHGVNTADAEKKYEKYLDSLSSRADLNYLFRDMLSDITSGHLRGNGGTIPTAKTVPGGLLGADYEIVNGRYRFKKIYQGESWDPQLQAPLVQPGLEVKEGDFLLAVNGQDLQGTDDVSRLLENQAGKPVVLKIAGDAAGGGAHEITVTPVASDTALRHAEWIADNRRKVDQLSGGKLAYVYLPDTAQGGLTSFNRYYFAQSDKQGAVIDERFNSGGQVADYIIEVLNRKLLAWWSPRYGALYRTPAASILGPKVMIINEMAGSGGDCMPWMFRYTKTGPLIGKRTWGGLIGVGAYPALMDGGSVTAPSFGFFSPNGEWDVENHGVPPDFEVEQDPKQVHEGHDPQLERAVAVALEQLAKNPPPTPKRPEFPNYQRTARPASGSTAGGGNRE
ncbi:MAG TPA: PDZ domain-containing protein [Candidatus Acidoferrales bacterium]|nr:PDZ domain-containing protein [Candidatus Acidoferrales bacterium]